MAPCWDMFPLHVILGASSHGLPMDPEDSHRYHSMVSIFLFIMGLLIWCCLALRSLRNTCCEPNVLWAMVSKLGNDGDREDKGQWLGRRVDSTEQDQLESYISEVVTSEIDSMQVATKSRRSQCAHEAANDDAAGIGGARVFCQLYLSPALSFKLQVVRCVSVRWCGL